ncbi:hypothetical protein [Streptacidiphilus melanogenes]|uniref:hypothetical protein n=1 Tax=Streptacidiphilus melanogenes TaxID=411235 RepID=UPI0005AAACFA|nr:hypothetical protein [Streptacidiphilus melanogenes]
MREPGASVKGAWTRWIWAIGFAEGTVVHAWYLLQGGLHAYRGEPVVVQLWFQLLLLLDPLVVVLALRRTTSAAWLGAVVMLGDVTANWWVCWDDLLRHPAAYARPYGLSAITVFGIFVLATAVPLHGAFARTSRPGAPVGREPVRS